MTTNSESSASGPASARCGGTPPVGETGAAGGHTAKPLTAQSSEFLEYLAYYLNARADRLKLTGRQALFRVEREIVALLVLAGAAIVAVTLLFVGVAEGLTQLFGNRSWLGHLAAGGLLLGVVGVAAGAWAFFRQRIARERTVEKYEQRKRQQQAKFGRTVAEQAANHRDE